MNLDELERLDRLRSAGALTEAEFEAHKRALLRKAPSFGNRWFILILIGVALVLIAYSALVQSGDEAGITLADPSMPAPVNETVSIEIPGTTVSHDSAVTVPDPEQRTTPRTRSGGFSATEQELIENWERLNSVCRGGSGDDPSTMQACEERETAYEQLQAANICYGREDESGAEHQMHRCDANSLR